MRNCWFVAVGFGIVCNSAMAQPRQPVHLLQPSVGTWAGAAEDQFGQSVAVSGDTIVVGAPYDHVGTNVNQGSAHVYRRTETGWEFEATLSAEDGAANDAFGTCVAVASDRVIVGAYNDRVGINNSQGSAYVFVRSGDTWTQEAQLIAPDGNAGDALGSSVAISGDTAIVGAYNDDVGDNDNQGSAYVFIRTGTGWIEQARLSASDGAAHDALGIGVALFQDTAVLGAYGADVGANANQGSAYVFARAGTTWTQQAKLTDTGGGANGWSGVAVDIVGDTALVGAFFDTVSGNLEQGSAAVFVRSGTSWAQQARLTAPDGAAGDRFGLSVALSVDTALVGVYGDNVGLNSNQGSARAFVRSGATWTHREQLTAEDGGAHDWFGADVALSGDTAIVGGSLDDIGTNHNQGSAWVFDRTPRCPADIDDDGNFENGFHRDGAVTIEDLLAVGAAFGESGNTEILDMDDGSGTGTPDGSVDINDLLFFLVRFEAGC